MKGGAGAGRGRRPGAGRGLRRLIEQALVDCYTEDEQHGAFLVMLDDHVACPLKARVVGEEVEIRGFDWDGSSQGIVAICRRPSASARSKLTPTSGTPITTSGST